MAPKYQGYPLHFITPPHYQVFTKINNITTKIPVGFACGYRKWQAGSKIDMQMQRMQPKYFWKNQAKLEDSYYYISKQSCASSPGPGEGHKGLETDSHL